MYLPLNSPRKTKLMIILAVGLLVFVAVAATAKKMFSIRVPHGSPLGLSVRSEQHIATLIQTLEPYVPSLNRSGGNDRFRVGVFVYPVDGSSPGHRFPIADGFTANDLNTMELIGGDGRFVWCHIKGLVGVDLQTGKLIGADQLRRANPGLGEQWDDTRRMTFEKRLRVASTDRQQIFELDPGTLKATQVNDRRVAARHPLEPKPESFLAKGAFPSATEWLGLLSARDAERSYKQGSWVRRGTSADDAKELRQLYKGTLGPTIQRSAYELLSIAVVPGDGLLNAAFVSADPDGEPIRLSGPGGFLVAYTSEPGLTGTLVVARVDLAGQLVWKIDTGLHRLLLKQILPDTRFPAFVGTRLPIPDKVSEPLLVVIDAQTGKAVTSSLWK